MLNSVVILDIATDMAVLDPTCYDIDTFKAFIVFENLLQIYRVSFDKSGATSGST